MEVREPIINPNNITVVCGTGKFRRCNLQDFLSNPDPENLFNKVCNTRLSIFPSSTSCDPTFKISSGVVIKEPSSNSEVSSLNNSFPP